MEEESDVDVIELNEEDYIEDDFEGDPNETDEQQNEEAENDDDDMETVPDDADLVFDKHTGSVFSCDLAVSGDVAVSGGEDDLAYVWNTSNGETILKCEGHKDSVISVCFNHDGTLVATADMNGLIQIWKLTTKTLVTFFQTSDLEWLRWHSSSNVLLAGGTDGSVSMWHTSLEKCKVFAGNGSSAECCKLLSDGIRMAIGYKNGSIYIWDMKSLTATHKITGELAHKDSVVCIESYSDNLLLTGSVDGTAKFINPNNGKILGILDCVNRSEESDEDKLAVECVGFCKTHPLCATGSLDGNLKIWDISTQVQLQTCHHEAGIIRLLWDHESPMVYTAAMDGVVRQWDARNGKLINHWSGHTKEILDMSLSRDGNTIITASDDKTCRVFHISKPDR